jgi:NAD+ kinase
MKRIVLYPNPKRDIGLKQTYAVKSLLDDSGEAECVIIKAEYSHSEIAETMKGADMVITFGGDGTILHAARYAAKQDVPILGINTGNKGFMAELENVDPGLIMKAVRGDCDIERRMMLDTEVIRGSETVYEDFALNDVVIGGRARILHMTVKGDGRLITELAGDGVVIATPTGSTAYSMAAGGPIMEPSAENIIITPICAHQMSAKSFVLVPEREVEIHLLDEDNRNEFISADGGEAFDLRCGDDVRIKRSGYVTKLIRVTETSFYEKVAKKLKK